MNKYWAFQNEYKNPNYESGVHFLPFGSCLIEHNSEKNRLKESLKVQFEPKSKIIYNRYDISIDGELIYRDSVESDDLKRANNRKIKALKSFYSYYAPLYKSQKVSLFAFTFTQANMAKMDFSSMLENIKYKFKSLKIPIRGYIWTSEVTSGLHWHYHLCVATDRYSFNNLDVLKFDTKWGQRTQVETIKSVHGITKYLSKQQPKTELRNFGKSQQFK